MTMRFARHVADSLAAYRDGQVPPRDIPDIERHLAGCPECRAADDEIRFVAPLVRRLPLHTPPDSVWTSIDTALTGRARGWWAPPLRTAATWMAVLTVTAAAIVWVTGRPAPQFWQVERRAGAVSAAMAEGEWVETDSASTARIIVADIGTVDVSPDTRVRLGNIDPAEYRLSLTRGTLTARIAAPPRLFFVDTPASTVVDLGCAYTMTVDQEGTGVLRVTEGWASLEWNGRESLVPAGARSRVQGGVGPGTPYFDDASPALVDAVAAFDTGTGGSPALLTIFRESRPRDTLTLWHLLSRVGPAERSLVYDRIAELTPAPAGLSRELVLALDGAALRYWREELAWTW
jgi:hypothetical protein